MAIACPRPCVDPVTSAEWPASCGWLMSRRPRRAPLLCVFRVAALFFVCTAEARTTQSSEHNSLRTFRSRNAVLPIDAAERRQGELQGVGATPAITLCLDRKIE